MSSLAIAIALFSAPKAIAPSSKLDNAAFFVPMQSIPPWQTEV